MRRGRQRGREAPTAAAGGRAWCGRGRLWRGSLVCGSLGCGLRGWLWRGFGGWLFRGLGEGLGESLGDVGLAGPPEDLVVAQVAVVRDCLHVAFGGLDEFDEVAVVVGEAHVHGVGPPYLRA